MNVRGESIGRAWLAPLSYEARKLADALVVQESDKKEGRWMLLQDAHKAYGSTLSRCVVESIEVVLADVTKAAEKRAEATLAAIYVRSEAAALADALEGQPMKDAQAAYAPHQKVLEEAVEAVKDAREAYRSELQKLLGAFEPGDGPMPTGDHRPVEIAEQALADAKANADDTVLYIRSLREKINTLRAIPGPDPADLKILADALRGAK